MDTRLPRPRWRTTLDFRLSPTLQAGIEINPGAEEVGFRGNWFAVRETPRLPAVVFGTSSDRIGTPSGYQSYFVTFSKQFENLPIAPYISLNYSEFERGMTFPFGVSLSLGREWLLMPMYDGHASHTVLTWSGRSESIGLVLAWNRQFGITFSYGF